MTTTALLSAYLLFAQAPGGSAGKVSSAPERADANALYLAGRYTDAARAYAAQLGTTRSADVAFNLGNAHAKSGDLARARAAFETALRLRAGDADAAANLGWVKKELERAVWRADETREEAAPFWVDFPLRFGSWQLELIVVLSSLLFFGVLAALKLAKRRGLRIALFYGSLVSLVLLTGALGLWMGRRFAVEWDRAAIVVADEATVRIGPSDKEDPIAALKNGRRVRVTGVSGAFLRVPWAGGLSGFVRREDVVEF